MIKCVKGFVEIKGSKNEVAAETAILLRSLREHISEDEFKEAIENSKKTVDELKAEAIETIAEIIKEALRREDK